MAIAPKKRGKKEPSSSPPSPGYTRAKTSGVYVRIAESPRVQQLFREFVVVESDLEYTQGHEPSATVPSGSSGGGSTPATAGATQ